MTRLRLAGFACLGVAAISFVLGVVTLFAGDGSAESAAPPPSSQVPTPGAPTGQPVPGAPGSSVPAPPATSAPGATSPGPGTTTQAAPPPGTQPPPAGGSGVPVGSQPDRSEPVRVYNNSTIPGLADRAAADIRGQGWNVVHVDNYSQGVVYQTTVYYRPGTEEEAEAKRLAEIFGVRAEPRFPGIADASPGIIVIVTKEYQGPKTGK